ncbi:MAG TPA: hypothetical protein VGM52_06850 [Herbaspirillum sp.]|jgi:hypothetical protein
MPFSEGVSAGTRLYTPRRFGFLIFIACGQHAWVVCRLFRLS